MGKKSGAHVLGPVDDFLRDSKARQIFKKTFSGPRPANADPRPSQPGLSPSHPGPNVQVHGLIDSASRWTGSSISLRSLAVKSLKDI
jgi:hypothetical protein